MLTGPKIIYFLTYQKMVPLTKLIDILDLKEEDVFYIATFFQRKVGFRLEEMYEKNRYKHIQERELLKFIYEQNKSGNMIKDIMEIFDISEYHLVEWIYYTKTKYPELTPVIFQNKEFKLEIEKIKAAKDTETLSKKKVKKISGNIENTRKIVTEAATVSIENLALQMDVSPYIIKKELIINGKGGFWENENIRKSLNFVTEASDKYQVEEILYIMQHKKEYTVKELAEKIKTTPENLEIFLKQLDAVNEKYTEVQLVRILKEFLFEYHRFHEANVIRELLRIEKDTKDYLFKYDMSKLLMESEKEAAKEFYTDIYREIENKRKNIIKNKNGIRILDNNRNFISGTKLGENLDVIIIKQFITDKQLKINKKDILQIKTF